MRVRDEMKKILFVNHIDSTDGYKFQNEENELNDYFVKLLNSVKSDQVGNIINFSLPNPETSPQVNLKNAFKTIQDYYITDLDLVGLLLKLEDIISGLNFY